MIVPRSAVEDEDKMEYCTTLDEYLTRITPFGFSGAVLVAKNENIFLNKGYGMAVKDKGIVNTEKTVFGIGSLTKQFTAAAVLKLEMDGKLNTGDVLGEYLDTPKDKSGIEIHHLLTHTAGLINYTGEDYKIAYREESIEKILNSPLLFFPGENFKYSNAGYTMLAALIEVVSGLPYEEYVYEHLFNPAGMEFTGYAIPDWDNRVVAHWYTDTDNQNALKKFYPYWNIMGNGEMLSTVEDLYKWYESLKHDIILSKKAQEKLFTPFLNDYAYGWEVTDTEKGTLIRHGGANDLGSSAEVAWWHDKDVFMVCLCNQWYGGTALTYVVKDKIGGTMFGEQYPIPPEVVRLDSEALMKYVGDYNLPSGGRITISMENNSLFLQAKGQNTLDLLFSCEADSKRLNAHSHKIFDAAVKGDYEPFLRVLLDRKRVQRFRMFIEGDIGKIEGFDVLGTIPFTRKDVLETLIHITAQDGSITLGLLWEKDHIMGMRIAENPVMYVNPLSDVQFLGYHLGMAKNIDIKFDIRENVTTGLTVYGKVAVYAQKSG